MSFCARCVNASVSGRDDLFSRLPKTMSRIVLHRWTVQDCSAPSCFSTSSAVKLTNACEPFLSSRLPHRENHGLCRNEPSSRSPRCKPEKANAMTGGQLNGKLGTSRESIETRPAKAQPWFRLQRGPVKTPIQAVEQKITVFFAKSKSFLHIQKQTQEDHYMSC